MRWTYSLELPYVTERFSYIQADNSACNRERLPYVQADKSIQFVTELVEYIGRQRFM